MHIKSRPLSFLIVFIVHLRIFYRRFIFVSIPMMEKHILEKSKGYAEYQKRVSMLILWPKKAKSHGKAAAI